ADVDIWIDKLVSAVQSYDDVQSEEGLVVNGASSLDANGLAAEPSQDTVSAHV
ncbi:hypothetical protein EV175_003233, partial [Coemansia sp. RSA 1933]